MVNESWFRSLWRSSKKHDISHENAVIGVLAFELASLMSKLINLWESLGDNQVAKLREEITNTVGIRKLVSEDEDYIVKLMTMELMENLSHIARTVSRISKKCNDPVLKSFEQAFNDMCRIGVDPYGWLLNIKKMEKKIKKMERLVVFTADLYQEIDALKDMEHTLKRIKSNDDVDSISLVEYEKKIAWKRLEVKNLKRISIWNRTYDYMVLLFASSLFTILRRTGLVFGIDYIRAIGVNDSPVLESEYTHPGYSTAFTSTQSSVHPSENNITRFSSGPIIESRNKKIIHSSAPLRTSRATSGPISTEHDIMNFYSGPLVKSVSKSGMLAKASKSGFRLWQFRNQLSFLQVKIRFSRHSKLKTSVNMDLNYDVVGFRGYHSIFISRNRLLNNAPVETLGGAALALHYANIIIIIEKLATSPHLISQDARVDLYNMLPTSIKNTLTSKLRHYAKILTRSVYDKVLATEWNECMSEILEWLAPLAHNMIRWQTERSYEQQNSVPRTNVLLVQTLYFANQEKTEATVIELLLGLNYVSRYGKELNDAALMECTSDTTFDDYLES